MLEPKETFEISVVRFNWISDDNCSHYKLHRNSLACLRGPINTSYSIKWICSKEFKGQTRRIYQRIHLSAGTAGDSFSFQRGAPFSTKIRTMILINVTALERLREAGGTACVAMQT